MKFFQGEGFRRGAWSEHFQKQTIFRFSAHALCDEENYLGR